MSNYEQIGKLACQMADALQEQHNGNHDKAVSMMNQTLNDGEKLNDERFFLLHEGMSEAIDWVHFCDRHKLSFRI